MRHLRWAARYAGASAFVFFGAGASATDLSNNLGNATTGTEAAAAQRQLASSFATGSSAHTLNSVTLLLSGSAGTVADVSIHVDGGLEPGAVVASLNAAGPIPTGPGAVVFTSAGGVALAANATYWVVVRPASGTVNWAWTADNSGTGVGFGVTWALSEDAGTFWWSHENYPLQMGVTVDSGVCYADCNADGALNLSDFGCFQTKFALADPYADCNGDGALNLADFGCFQTKFALGCP